MKDILLSLFVLSFAAQLAAGGLLFPFHGWLTCAFGFAYSAWGLGGKLWCCLKSGPPDSL